MKTKAYVRFLNRIEHYAADIELVDVLARSQHQLTRRRSRLFDETSPALHPTLSKRKVSSHNRTLAFTHLKGTIAAAHIKHLYEDVTLYLRDLLAAAIRRGLDHSRLIGEHDFKTDARTLLRLGSWSSVLRFVSDGVFRSLENLKSTKELLAKMDSKLGLGVSQAIVDSALPYLEARHILVHRDGVVDGEYASSHKSLHLRAGDSLPVNYDFVVAARTAIGGMVFEFDSRVIAKHVVSPSDTQP
jgi:hypothetical protein